jgi:tetratricopeptide (TPR) repeat protein
VNPKPHRAGATEVADSVVRIAVVQLDFHPAFYDDGRWLLGEPLGRLSDGSAARLPLEGVPGVPAEELAALQARVATEYEAALSRKLTLVLEQCRGWGVRIVVLPEYAIPAGCLRAVADAAGDMVVIAGTHHVGRRERQSGIYEELGVAAPPRGTAVAPVLYGGRALILVPKCRAAPIAGEARSLNPGMGWAPVELPPGFPSPVAVATCIDFVAEDRPACAGPDVSLDEVRLWVVPSLTPTVEDFRVEARKQAKRRKRPVAYANSEHEGHSGIFVDIGDDEPLLVPLVLGAREEGIVVADVSWAGRGPGRSTGFDEPPVVVPVAAASFVYTATTADEAYGAWTEGLEKILSGAGDEALEFSELEEHVRKVRAQSFAGMPSTRKRRLDALVHRMSGLTKLEQLRCLTREVVFPPDVLPLDGVRAALAQGARDVLEEWLERDPGNAAAVKDVAVRYAGEAKGVLGDGSHRWVAHARTEAERIAGVVRAGARREIRGYEQLAGTLTFYTAALDEVLDRDFKVAAQAMDDERFEEARDALGAMLEGAEKRVLADPERREARAWRSRLRLMKAITLFNLHDPGAAASEVRVLERDALPAAHWRDLVVLLAELGELTDARAFLDAAVGVELPEKVRTKLDRAALHVELCAGQRPRELPDDAPDLLRKAAQLELEQGRFADAVCHARRAAEREPLRRSTRLLSLNVLVTALRLSVFEIGAPGGWLTQGEQAAVIETIEGWLVEVDAWVREGLALLSGLYDRIRLHYFALVKDPGRLAWRGAAFEGSDHVEEPWALAKGGQVERALEELAELPSTGSPWLDEIRRIDLLVLGGQQERALAPLVRLSQQFPNRGPIEYELARIHARRGHPAHAVSHAERAVEQLPCSGYRLLLAECLNEIGQRERAWNILNVDRDRNSLHTLRLLAHLAETLHPSETVPLWGRLVALEPDDPGVEIDYALALRRAGRMQDAAEHAWRVLDRYHHDLPAKAIYFCAMLQDLSDGSGLSSIARERMKRASTLLHERHATDPQAHLFRLQIRTRLGRDEENDAPVDFRLLEEAGLVTAFSADDVVQRLIELAREGETTRAARWHLYSEGGAPLEAIATAMGRPLGELVFEMLEEDEFTRFCSYMPMMDPVFDPTESLELLLGATELLLLLALDLEGAFLAAMRRGDGTVVVPEESWERLRAEREVEGPATDALRRSASLARRALAFVEVGREEQWLFVRSTAELISEQSVLDIPPLRDPALDEELLRRPLERSLRLVEATRSQPGRWRVAVDFFGTWGVGHPMIAQCLNWSDPSEYMRVAAFLRSGRDRTVSFPALVRLLADRGDVDDLRRRRVLTRLARSGFVDALTAEDLVALSREDVALRRLDHALAGQEHMAKVTYMGVAEPARLLLSNTYARACFAAYRGIGTSQGLRDSDAGELVSALLRRIENLGGERGSQLESVLTHIAMIAVDHPRAAFREASESEGHVLPDPSTPTGRLWSRLNDWAGQDGHRRRALDRALRAGWCLLDRIGGDAGPSRRQLAPLMLASATDNGVVRVEADEALSILSASWGEQPLEAYRFDLRNDDHSIDLVYLDCVRYAAELVVQRGHGDVVSLDEREIRVRYPLEARFGAVVVSVPVEAALLRADPAATHGLLEDLRVRQGWHDGRAYRLICALLEAPGDRARQRAYARYTVNALWRLVRDDPSYLLQWPQQRSPWSASWPTMEMLYEMLHEPTGPIGEKQSSKDVFSERMNGTWGTLPDDIRDALFLDVMCLPGGLAGESVGLRLQPHLYVDQVEHAIHRLEHSTRYAAGLLANDVMFLRVAMAHRPEVELKRGTLDLRTIVPPLFESLLVAELRPPLGSLADDEPKLLRAAGIVVRELLARHPDRGAHDFLWLTYRLHGWFLDQLAAAREEAKASGLARIRAIASKTIVAVPPNGGDLFDPFIFDARHFDYRLSVILFAMLAGEELVRHRDLVGTVEPPPVSTPGLEDHLLELARRDRPDVPYASSWFSWDAPDNAPDLALTLLLQLHPERVLELGDEHLAQRFLAWPEDVDALPEPRKRIIDGMVRVLATNCSKLDEDVRWQLGLKLSAFEDGELARKLRWLGQTGLYSAGASELETQVRASLQEHLAEPEAPIMASLFLQGLVAHRPQDLDAEMTHLYEAWRNTPDRVVEVLTVAVARLVIHGDAELARRATRLLADLAERPGFRDDPRLHTLLEHLHIEDEEDEP